MELPDQSRKYVRCLQVEIVARAVQVGRHHRQVLGAVLAVVAPAHLDARDLRERAIFAPARDRFKIFILDEAHMVTPQGFNALLKIVEEPPVGRKALGTKMVFKIKTSGKYVLT